MNSSTAKHLKKGVPTAADVAIASMFLHFLLIGATSFGRVIVAYLRSALLAERGWIADKEFMALASISRTLAGLNAANMAPPIVVTTIYQAIAADTIANF